MSAVLNCTTTLGACLAESRGQPFVFSMAALDAATREETSNLKAERAMQRTDATKRAIEAINAVDSLADYTQLHGILHATAELSARMLGRVSSAEMANCFDGINGAIGWLESLIKGDCTPLGYGGTDDE